MSAIAKYRALIRVTEECHSISWEDRMRFTADLVLSEDTRHDLKLLNDNSLLTDLRVDGIRPSSSSSENLIDYLDKTLTISVELPMPDNECAVVRSFEDLLLYPQFLRDTPTNFYEIEKRLTELPREYSDTVAFATFLIKISDHVEKSDSVYVCFFYSGAKLRIPIKFSKQDLCLIQNFEEFLQSFNVYRHVEKINFFRSAIVKVGITSQTERKIFSHLQKNFSVIQKTFENDFNLYLADFSLEKVLGEIEEKTIKIADKIAASLSDLQKTMITIPLAIIFATPRIDLSCSPKFGQVC